MYTHIRHNSTYEFIHLRYQCIKPALSSLAGVNNELIIKIGQKIETETMQAVF